MQEAGSCLVAEPRSHAHSQTFAPLRQYILPRADLWPSKYKASLTFSGQKELLEFGNPSVFFNTQERAVPAHKLGHFGIDGNTCVWRNRRASFQHYFIVDANLALGDPGLHHVAAVLRKPLGADLV